jgi:primase-polymerase (primpol)-like protein
MTYLDLPSAMREAPRWMCYQLEPDPKHPDKPRKVPMQSRRIGVRARSTDPNTWATFDVAIVALSSTGEYRGLGFALGDGWIGVDLDHVVDLETGEIARWALDIIEQLDSYTEYSPSGTGIHMILRGSKPEGWSKIGDIEMYDRGRYFTVTGRALSGTSSVVAERTEALASIHARYAKQQPAKILIPASSTRATSLRAITASDAEIIERATRAKAGTRFSQLWAGNWDGYASQSEADLALCSDLMYWCDGDISRVDALFRSSGLAREKWDHQRGELSYGERTLATALASWRGRPQRKSQSRTLADVPVSQASLADVPVSTAVLP